jgi:hypothetical protein
MLNSLQSNTNPEGGVGLCVSRFLDPERYGEVET